MRDAFGRTTAPYYKEFFAKPTPIEGSRIMRVILGGSNIGPVQDVFVSEDQGLKSIEIKVSSPSENGEYCMDT